MRTFLPRILVAPLLAVLVSGCPDDRVGDGIFLPEEDVETSLPDLPDIPDGRAVFGEACDVDTDCQSGICGASAAGGVCTMLCNDDCPDGTLCVPAGADGPSVCVTTDALACQPCTVDEQCNFPGTSGGACVDYGAAGSFCGVACSEDGDCPSDFSCNGDGQCVSDSETCRCNRAGVVSGASTSCTIANDVGSCPGTRQCSTSGLTRCTGQTPAAEICNGVDDDCDGDTDEDTDGQACEITNEFGTCIGERQCGEGLPLCVGKAPAAEICNGIDDDCDGETDEDQPDLDLDDIPDCLDPDIDGDGSLNEDDCAPRNNAIYPEATEVCDGIDQNCNFIADDGTDDNAADECGCYTCAGTTGCREDCATDAHCITGYLCDVNDDNHNENNAECLPSVCGNGEVEIREVCDNGINSGAYGGCAPGCRELGPRCGDGVTTEGFETCDDGPNNGQPNRCNLTCNGITPSDCNNFILEEGELCDDPNGNSNEPGGVCRTDCTPRRCGDGITDPQSNEACDAGSANGTTLCGCTANCQFPGEAVACRESGGTCDIAEFCNDAGVCPADAKVAAQTECRAAVPGGCDVAEACDGESPLCPEDAVMPAETTCREGDLCDVEEQCDGETAMCPADVLRPSGFECRGSVGLCDIAETCNGRDTGCPDDAVQPSNIVCADKVGLCDVADRCDGETGTCPTEDNRGDAVATAGTVCRQAPGLCDVAEMCDGTAKACPDDVLREEGFECRPSVGGNATCDPAELCNGTTGSCPTNTRLNVGASCGSAAGICATAQVCNEGYMCVGGENFEDNTPCETPGGVCSDAPCSCQMGMCEPLCGNGVVDDDFGEQCDAGDLTGARDYCNLFCEAVCDNDFAWAESGGGFGRDDARDVAVDEAGNSYTAGTFERSNGGDLAGPQLGLSFNAATFAGEVFFAQSGREGYIMKYDTDENPQWASCILGSNETDANGVHPGRDGSVYATGRYTGYADVDCCNNSDTQPQEVRGASNEADHCQYIDAPTGGSDFSATVWVGRWSADGDLMWATSAGSFAADHGYDLESDKLDNIVVVGEHGGTEFDPLRFTNSPMEIVGSGGGDALVAKYTALGSLVWAKGFGGTGRETATSVALDGTSSIFVTGTFESAFDVPSDASLPVSPANGGEYQEVYVAKLNPNGEGQWVATAYSGNDAMGVTDIVVDGAGNSYIIGGFEGEAFFGDLQVGAIETNSTEIYVAKLDPAGAWVWVAIAGDHVELDGQPLPFGGSYDDYGYGLSVDRSGKVLITGSFQGAAVFGTTLLVSEPSCENQEFGPSEGPGCGGPATGGIITNFSVDGFNAKLSADGEWLWAKSFGGAYTDRGLSVRQDPRGNAYVVGSFEEQVQFGDEFLFADYTFFPESDAFVSKMLPDGAPACFECGDGQVDAGEGCDDADMLDHCAGTCDGICFGPADSCGDGWTECGEDFDIGGGSALEAEMCLAARDPAWCFEVEGDPETTLDPVPVSSGLAMTYGPGLENPGFAEGNADQLAICPVLTGNGSAATAEQWDGDGPPANDCPEPPCGTARTVCDGIPDGFPVSQAILIGPLSGFGGLTTEENAAIECGDYFQFVGNTGDDPSFEFDDRSSGDPGATNSGGPNFWSLWVSPSGEEGTFERVIGGNTTRDDTFDGPPPYHSVDLSSYEHAMGPIADSFNVHYRLYAWGSPERTGDWDVDNVRVGPITNPIELPTPISHWAGEYTGANEISGAPELVGIGGPDYDFGQVCTGFDVSYDAIYTTDDPTALPITSPTLTLSAWVFTTSSNAGNGKRLIAGKWGSADGDDRTFGLFVDDAGFIGFQVNVAGGLNEVVSTVPFQAFGPYVNVTGTYDGALIRLYVDGAVVASQAATGAITDIERDFQIAGIKDTTGSTFTNGFDGLVDEVRVYAEALTPIQIQALVTRDRAPRTDCPGPPPPMPEVMINEFHYDNDSFDIDEGVEIAGPSGTDLAGWTVALYNGSSTQRNVYDTIDLSGVLGDNPDGVGYLFFDGPIQNGSPDGLALVDPTGQVREFLSYEGSFVAAEGPAEGLTSVDVGVAEIGSRTPVGHSIQRMGTGCVPSDFGWGGPTDHTRGAINASQVFDCSAP